MTIESDIWAALKARVATLTVVPANRIAWPNVAFTPPAPSASWLRVTHIPNRNRRLFLGSDEPHQRQGLLQIDCFTPKGRGSEAGLEMAAAVAAHFPCDLQLTSGSVTVRITKAPDAMQAIAGDTHEQTPVVIEYEAFA